MLFVAQEALNVDVRHCVTAEGRPIRIIHMNNVFSLTHTDSYLLSQEGVPKSKSENEFPPTYQEATAGKHVHGHSQSQSP